MIRFHLPWNRLKEKKILVPIVGILVVSGSLLTLLGPKSTAIATTDVKRGPFSVSITVSGEVRAANSVTLSAPRVWTSKLQIEYMVPEGTTVPAGEVVARFLTTEADKQITDKQSELSILQSELAKLKADQASRMADLEANLKNVELGYEQAKLQLEKVKFEAEVVRREAEINLEKNRIANEQAQRKIESQKIVDKSEEDKHLTKMKQTEGDLSKAIREKEMHILKAPTPGLVVYEVNWSTQRKVNVGDTPWPGMPVVSLPDLSKMQVATNVNEVDVSKVQKGQSVRLKLDAFPDQEFQGTVASVAKIGQQRDRSSSVKTFEVIVDIEGTDPILKPGMTTSSEIMMETIPEAIYIPLESVFQKNGKTVVYKMDGSSPKEQEVEVGVKNSNYVIITTGLKEGEKVTLRDPTLKQEEGLSKAQPKEASL